MRQVIASIVSKNNPLPSAQNGHAEIVDVANRSFVEAKENDILCGRGRAPLKHPGNAKFFAVVQDSVPTYVAAPGRYEKGLVIARLVGLLQGTGARFLKLDLGSGRYYEISIEQARAKTGHAIRDLLRYKNETKNTRGGESAPVIRAKKKKKTQPKKGRLLKKSQCRSKSAKDSLRLKKSLYAVADPQSSTAGLFSDQRVITLKAKSTAHKRRSPCEAKSRSCTTWKDQRTLPNSNPIKHLRKIDLRSFETLCAHSEAMTSEYAPVLSEDENRNRIPNDELSYVSDHDEDEMEPCSPHIFDLDLSLDSEDWVPSLGVNNLCPGNIEISNCDEEAVWHDLQPISGKAPEIVRLTPVFPSFSSWDSLIDDLFNEDTHSTVSW